MTPLSICPEIAAAKGISYTELVEIILKEATFEQ
jgi:D-alanine-D-alanine ligase-like ATP-grasp enzyme